MWCTGCGAPLSATARYCSHCGRPIAVGTRALPPSNLRPTTPGDPCESGREMAGVTIDETGVAEAISGETLCGFTTTGEQTLYEVTGPRELHLWVAYVQWACGEREIRRTRRYETAWWQDQLFGRQRLAVETWGADFDQVELCQAQLDGGRALRLAEVSEYELDAFAGTCLRCALKLAGATAMGTRQEVLGVGDERRRVLCVTFPRPVQRVPIAAFVLTRIMPLINRVSSASA